MFMQQVQPTAANMGTAMHHLLMLLPADELRDVAPMDMLRAVRTQADMLRETGVLSQ